MSAGELFIRCTDLDPIWYTFCGNTVKEIAAEPKKPGAEELDLRGVSGDQLVREFTEYMRASPWRSTSPASEVVRAALLVKHRVATSQLQPRKAAAAEKPRTTTRSKARRATSKQRSRRK